MQIETVFLSVNAKDFAAQTRWWTTFLGRPHDREPMPSCHEWSLRDGVLFQVLDDPEGDRTDVALRIDDLEKEIGRLRQAGISVPDPAPVDGFETLVWAQTSDPEGNPVHLLHGA